ncbi:hypothetical protein ACQI4F_13400 [Mycolicibacterium vaccae]|uniref:hypothetical protein n=1 Tax=Mycolicibacterium vaccae TaxID=1810 RepID=UPI003CF44661
MTLKPLVTSLTAGVATAFVMGAAVGVTSIAVGTGTAAASPAVLAPLPAAPAPELQGPLVSTLNALMAPGSFAGKGAFIEGGMRLRDSIVADRAYASAAAKGYFPLSFAINDIVQNGPTATANVTATAPSGSVTTQPLTFVAGPSPTGWQLSKSSAVSLVTAVG